MDKITQKDSDNLADIIWWIKGTIDAKKLNDEWNNTFCEDHIQSLKKYRLAVKIEENNK